MVGCLDCATWDRESRLGRRVWGAGPWSCKIVLEAAARKMEVDKATVAMAGA